jgi:hypothetical protein
MHRRDVLALIPVLGILAALVHQGCVQKTAEESKEHTVRKVPAEPPVSAPEHEAEQKPDTSNETKDDFERTLNERLDNFEEQVIALKAKAATLQDAAKARWIETAADLDTKRQAAQTKLDEIRKSTGDAWEHLRDGTKSAWKNLEEALHKAQAEF